MNAKRNMIAIDDNAHAILYHVKKYMQKQGINSPGYSDTIRYLFNQADRLQKPPQVKP